jgi:BirA family biotin operon repressor/biotin-[acetyl-CoA-carboxylase] ligase
MSIVLFPHFIEIDRHFHLSKFISLALCRYIRHFVHNTFIKWPNDIFCNDKKICGILIENSIEESKINNSIIGIGLNVNQTDFKGDFSATSLHLETKNEFDLSEVLNDLIIYLNIELKRLVEGGYEETDKIYISLLYNYEKWRKYKDKRGVFEGKIIGLEKYGELIVLRKNNDVRTYGFKEISLV